MSETKVIIALLAGLAAGAALGVLFTPEEGPETRDKLSEALTDVGESVKSSASEQIDNLSALFKDKVIDTVKELLGGKTKPEQADDLEHA